MELSCTIDKEIIEEVEKIINDEEFAKYLLNHTVNFESAALILDTLIRKVDELKEKIDEKEEN